MFVSMANHQNANETRFSSTTGVVKLIQFVNNFPRYFLHIGIHLNLFWKAMLLKMYLKLSTKRKEEFMFRDVSNLKLRQTISLQLQDCLLQILLGLFLNTLNHILLDKF